MKHPVKETLCDLKKSVGRKILSRPNVETSKRDGKNIKFLGHPSKFKIWVEYTTNYKDN